MTFPIFNLTYFSRALVSEIVFPVYLNNRFIGEKILGQVPMIFLSGSMFLQDGCIFDVCMKKTYMLRYAYIIKEQNSVLFKPH